MKYETFKERVVLKPSSSCYGLDLLVDDVLVAKWDYNEMPMDTDVVDCCDAKGECRHYSYYDGGWETPSYGECDCERIVDCPAFPGVEISLDAVFWPVEEFFELENWKEQKSTEDLIRSVLHILEYVELDEDDTVFGEVRMTREMWQESLEIVYEPTKVIEYTENPLLQFYADETWGYNVWDEESKKKEGISIKFQQEKSETREDFFKRVGFEPKAKMYGSDLEIDKKARDKDWYIRWTVAEQGLDLDILVHDEDWRVREKVASHGFGLGILINDERDDVRYQVASQGYGLDILVHDEDRDVRAKVARQGFGLDILVHDKAEWVRREVAEQGYGLDVLVRDENNFVRQAVARQGYGLDVLAHDEERWVRFEVERYLDKHDYPSIEAWIEENPKKCADRKNRR